MAWQAPTWRGESPRQRGRGPPHQCMWHDRGFLPRLAVCFVHSLLGVVLEADERVGALVTPGVDRRREAALHAGGDLRLELRRIEGADEAVDASLQAAVDEEDGGLSHEPTRTTARTWVPRHERLRVALQHEPAHLRIRRHHHRRPEQVRPENRAPVLKAPLVDEGLRAGRVGAGHEVQCLAHHRPPEAAGPPPAPCSRPVPRIGDEGGAAASLPSALTLPTSNCYRRLALRPHTAAAARPGVNHRAALGRARIAPRRSSTAPLLPPAREPRELLVFILLRPLLGVQQAGREVQRGQAVTVAPAPGEGARGDGGPARERRGEGRRSGRAEGTQGGVRGGAARQPVGVNERGAS
ncbi:LOW QUALITY PROTEIN: hypothetical protein SETIT_5G043600v2 [Setaria italica]|uniref:Uncharacterized protein n=1 Tax=Setaria italica TaxID=4555 RepID=A0A368R305_SETIT|nr:LOW QUALITY PROTEIN: hypothetical protein SETIT_5G043600v2 [Setaria italica]